MKLKCAFLKIAQRVSESTGHPISFISALAFVLIWAARPCFKIFQYLGALYKYRHDYHNFFDGIPDPKYAEPG